MLGDERAANKRGHAGVVADAASESKSPLGASPGAAAPVRWRVPWAPFVALALFLATLLVPSVGENPRLGWTFAGVAAFLAAWAAALWLRARSVGRAFEVQFTPIRSHWVQASVQFSILAYWGWFVPAVPAHAPLIAAQVFYLYAFDALLTWSRGRVWRVGFGPLPIIFSTNLLLWFKPEWFALQFVMVTLGALGKHFVTWERDGRRTHIFNPSAFGQSVCAVALIATGTTRDLTLGHEIAASFDVPHMLVVIFLGGLIVQSLFHVTLMTFAAAAALCLVDLVFHAIYGTYFFVNINIAAPIFLGIHLLMTDPATSPRTNVGRVAFGFAYGLAYAALFHVLDVYEVPTFWDKLLPVPILNLCVPWIDRSVRAGWLANWNRKWETWTSPARANAVHMTAWALMFGTWVATGFVEAPHPGDSIPFWKQAHAEGKPFAGHGLVMAAGSQAEGNHSGAAYNELGLICLRGEIVRENRPLAAKYFAQAAELGDPHGASNVVAQFLVHREHLSDAVLEQAFTRVEALCAGNFEGPACYLLGTAHETGRGRPKDVARALQLYMRCDIGNPYAAKGIARIGLTATVPPAVMRHVARVLEPLATAGDAESSWYLAFLCHAGIGVDMDEARARQHLRDACAQGFAVACDLAGAATFPAYSKPESLSAPPFSTAFPDP